MPSSTLLLQIILSGLVTGLIYMLIALGVTLLFGIMRVVNFVHGELVMLSAFAIWFIGVDQGWPMWIAIPLAVAVAAAIAVLCQKVLFKPLQYDILNCFIVGIGASFAIRSAAWAIFGPEPEAIPAMLPGVVKLGGVFMAKQRLLAAGVCVVLAVALYLFLHFTRPGKAMRAVEQDREAAMLMGINPESVYVTAFIISAALAAVGGAMLGSVFGVDPEMGVRTVAEIVHHRADRRHGQHRRNRDRRTVHRRGGQRHRHAARWRTGVHHRLRDPDADPDRPPARAVRLRCVAASALT